MTHFFPSHPSLKSFISAYLVVSYYFEAAFEHSFSARGIPMLCFPFKAPSNTSYRYAISGNAYPNAVMDEPALLNASSEYAHSTFSGDINFVMVMLQPTAVYHLLQSGLGGLASHVDVLDNYGLPPFFNQLQDQLWKVNNAQQAVKLIDYQLSLYFKNTSVHNKDVSPVLHHIQRVDAQISVRELSQKFRCSERWLEKQFLLQTGISPKTWLRMFRFRAASNYLLQKPDTSWMELVAKFNYTDQSHLIRDFKAFSGSTPAQHFRHYGENETHFNQHRVGLISEV
jgi:AraC-like DNA-binding protein